MQQFLDACWLYGDKEKISTLYMLPVAMSITHGEKEAALTLINAWEMLGGMPCSELSGYVDDLLSFEMNEQYTSLIEKTAENLYRSIRQKYPMLPTSNQAVKKSVLRSKGIELTPQESEQLSKFVSDETYVKQQKEDIEELSAMFKQMLRDTGSGEERVLDVQQVEILEVVEQEDREEDVSPAAEVDPMINALVTAFRPEPEFIASYAIIISDQDKILHVHVSPEHVKCFYAATDEADVILRTTTKVLETIMSGRSSFQKGFMAGEISAKGNFKTLRMLDTIFDFSQ